jgi:type VI secretion system protein ImpK
MSEQNPPVSNDEQDDRTVFQPGPRPASRGSTETEGLDSSPPADDRTLIRLGERPEPGSAKPRSPAADAATETEGPDSSAPTDDRTLVRPGVSLRRPGTAVLAERHQPGSAPPPPRQSAIQSLGLEAPNVNPLLRAAGPLLLLLGHLRTSLLRATDSSLMPQIAAAIAACERELQASEVAAEEIRTVKFILCVTADEVLANLPRGTYDVTQRSGLLTRFFGESDGGRGFLEELDRARENPKAHAFLLELFHACLVLGFQGGHSTLLGGPAALQDLRQDLHERLQQLRPSRSLALSPRWESQPLPGRAARVQIPVWAAASFIGLALFGIFVGLRVSLGARADAVATALLDVGPPARIEIRQEPVPPPSPPSPSTAQASRLEHIRKVLEPRIAAGLVDVQATPDQIVVEIAEKALFEPGKATLLEDARPLLLHVAFALDDAPGSVKVIGHHDPTLGVGARFASSFELSQERARGVAFALARALSDPSRATAEGKGADAPIASNDTAEGRSRNRRISIAVPTGVPSGD